MLAPQAVQQQFRRLQGGAEAGEGEGGNGGGGAARGQQPIVGDCPICFDELALPGRAPGGASGEAVSFCCTCGNNVHTACMQHWARSKRAQGVAVTCPLCRSPWADGVAPPGGGGGGGTPGGAAGREGQYINLAQYSEAHQGGTSLEELYGDSAVWIQARQGGGQLGLRQAASRWRRMGHY